jgi:hypothetical protein
MVGFKLSKMNQQLVNDKLGMKLIGFRRRSQGNEFVNPGRKRSKRAIDSNWRQTHSQKMRTLRNSSDRKTRKSRRRGCHHKMKGMTMMRMRTRAMTCSGNMKK